jgi:plasmid maintenance system killer protein
MISVYLTPHFRKKFKKLERSLQEEAFEKIELFKDPANHSRLRVHALKGHLHGRHSFSVNYRYRIVFMWEDDKTQDCAILLAIGDHAVYD